MFNFENWFLCQFSSNTWFFLTDKRRLWSDLGPIKKMKPILTMAMIFTPWCKCRGGRPHRDWESLLPKEWRQLTGGRLWKHYAYHSHYWGDQSKCFEGWKLMLILKVMLKMPTVARLMCMNVLCSFFHLWFSQQTDLMMLFMLAFGWKSHSCSTVYFCFISY